MESRVSRKRIKGSGIKDQRIRKGQKGSMDQEVKEIWDQEKIKRGSEDQKLKNQRFRKDQKKDQQIKNSIDQVRRKSK